MKVREQVTSCTRCPLTMDCTSPVPLSGPSPCEIAIVGEAPGHTEDEQHVPFVGLAGQLAHSWIDSRFGEVAWLNVVSCYPHRTPTTREIEACRVNLDAQLALIQPRLLLLFGGVAVSSWLSGYRIGEIRGRWWKAPVMGLDYHPWAMATWHPAAVLRNRTLEVEVLDDLRTFRESLGDNGIPPYVYRPCIKCGSVVGTHITDEGIAWCMKHWEWKQGTGGQGRPKTRASKSPRNKAKPSHLF